MSIYSWYPRTLLLTKWGQVGTPGEVCGILWSKVTNVDSFLVSPHTITNKVQGRWASADSVCVAEWYFGCVMFILSQIVGIIIDADLSKYECR